VSRGALEHGIYCDGNLQTVVFHLCQYALRRDRLSLESDLARDSTARELRAERRSRLLRDARSRITHDDLV
jgi:hypothetical protein